MTDPVQHVARGTCAPQPGEQTTPFLLDPCGNALAFTALAERVRLFAP